MSEPVSNADIEDVLSSIRRLISDNPADGPKNGAQGDADRGPDEAGQPDPAPNGKLVLTPALRVLEGEVTAAPETPAQDETAPRADPAGNPEPQVAQDQEPPAPPAGHAPQAQPRQAAHATSASELEQRIAELEAAIAETGDEWEPDGSETEDATPIRLHRVFEAPEPQPSQPAQPDSDAAGIVLEAAEVFTRPDNEAAAQAAPAEQAPEPEDAAAAQAPDDEDGADVILDEEALRDLVAELVREQLRGQVGERITRNIRRLVRREIRLALALRDME